MSKISRTRNYLAAGGQLRTKRRHNPEDGDVEIISLLGTSESLSYLHSFGCHSLATKYVAVATLLRYLKEENILISYLISFHQEF
jgi:hypothetical protein